MSTSYFEEEESHNCESEIQVLVEDSQVRDKGPKKMKQEIEFNFDNSNTFWWDTVCQDMKNNSPEFDPWEKPEGNIPLGYQEIECCLIFDIKMGENFLQKSRFIVGGHMIETHATLTYYFLVSR